MSKNIALVLSSGGARGFAHVGAIKVLEQNGFNITSVAGTSMGAVVGGVFATGQIQHFEEWLITLDIMEVLRLTDFSISKKGFVKGKKIIEKIKEIVPERNIEDLLIPFCAVATDIINGREVYFTKGSLFEALRASISIPTVLQPLKIGNLFFVDGGLMNPIPVNRVKRHDGDLLVVVDVNSPELKISHNVENQHNHNRKYIKKIIEIQSKFSNIIPERDKDHIGVFNLTNRSIYTMMRKISELTLEKCQPDLLINISHESFNIFDFYKAKEIIQEGERATWAALEDFVEVC